MGGSPSVVKRAGSRDQRLRVPAAGPQVQAEFPAAADRRPPPAARYYEQEEWLKSPFRKYTQWALADAARVCLAYGTEYNRADASEQDLLQILNAYSRFEDPVVRDHDARECLLRMAGQQMTWQASEPQALARNAAISTQTNPLKPAKYLRPGWTPRCSDARCRSTWAPPSWSG